MYSVQSPCADNPLSRLRCARWADWPEERPTALPLRKGHVLPHAPSQDPRFKRGALEVFGVRQRCGVRRTRSIRRGRERYCPKSGISSRLVSQIAACRLSTTVRLTPEVAAEIVSLQFGFAWCPPGVPPRLVKCADVGEDGGKRLSVRHHVGYSLDLPLAILTLDQVGQAICANASVCLWPRAPRQWTWIGRQTLSGYLRCSSVPRRAPCDLAPTPGTQESARALRLSPPCAERNGGGILVAVCGSADNGKQRERLGRYYLSG